MEPSVWESILLEAVKEMAKIGVSTTITLAKDLRSSFKSGEKSAKSRFKSLDGARFVTQYRQGRMIDKGVLNLRTSYGNRVLGEYEILYQYEDEHMVPQYPDFPDKLKVTGSFLHNSILLLSFDNKDGVKIHAGTILLVLDAYGRHFEGHYVVHFDPIPPERRQDRMPEDQKVDNGKAELWRCDDDKLIEKYMQHQVDIETIKNARRTRY